MQAHSMTLDREAIELARTAVDLDDSERFAWVLRCHRDFAVVERVLRLVLSFDQDADELGLQLAPPRPASADEPPLPSRVGGFRVLDLLGAGAFSRVYRAVNEATGKTVALKVLHFRSVGDEATLRFDREIEVLKSLRHGRIARFVEAGTTQEETGATRWIAIELVEGVSLRDAAEGRDHRWMASTVSRVARAIQYAHEAGVVHRDLKPSNVMVTGDGDVKVLDFGVAAIRDRGDRNRLTTTGQVVGTIAYMAPEQVAGHAANTASDQFSLAVMLFEAATGKLPHSDGADGLLGLFSIASWDGSIDPSLMSQLQEDLATILERALQVDPALRYPDVAAFADELERWSEGKRIQTARIGWTGRAMRFVRRNRKPVAAAAAAITVLSSALAVTVPALRKARVESVRAQSFGFQSLLPLLLREVDELWPQLPETVPSLERWMDRAESVMAHVEGSRSAIEGDADLASFTAQLAELPDAMAVVGERLALASTLSERTVDAYANEWYAASERVFADARFRGLEMRSQEGLIPLGPDPVSGFEEFAVADWGSIPRRDRATGELLREDDFTVVLVLLPGGPTQLGTPVIPEEERIYSGGRKLTLLPSVDFGIRDVFLDPFFIGKFETTQAQWQRITGTNPSEWRAGENNSGLLMTGLHPIETIDFDETLTAAQRIGCTLPTEAQWQFAAGAVERGFFWWSEARSDSVPLENVLSRREGSNGYLPWDKDPFPLHAPVGSFYPNPNGLFDIMGNVQERCLDDFKVAVLSDPTMELAPGTGQVMADGGGDHSVRGGYFNADYYNMTIPRRHGPAAHVRVGHTGVRFARSLVR